MDGIWRVAAASVLTAGLLVGCGGLEDSTNRDPSGPAMERGVRVGELELHYDFSAGEGTAAFTPNVEVTGDAANVSAIGVTGYFGKCVYDKRAKIPSLGAGNTGPACILGLAIANTGRCIINGPVLQVRMNHSLNDLYATHNGGKISQNVVCLDVDDGAANPGAGPGAHAFLCANDWGYPAAGGFGWSQTYEQIVGEAADAEWTTVDPVDGLARYHFYQVSSGWAGRTWAPAYELDGDNGATARGVEADAAPPSPVSLAMAFRLPLTPSNDLPTGIHLKGTLLADAIIDSHTLGPDAGWAPLGGGIQVGQSFDFETARGLAPADIAKRIDRDATGRIYVGYSDGANVNVARLRPDLTPAAGDDEITPPLATTNQCLGLDVVSEFSKIYVATGDAGGGTVHVFSIPPDGADGTAMDAFDVGSVEAFAGADTITDIVVAPNERMLYAAYGGAAGGDGVIVGYALNADGILTDNARDAISEAGIFDAATGGGKLAVNPTTGSVYVSSGRDVVPNGIRRLVASTLGADGMYDLDTDAQAYTNVVVSPTGVVHAAVENGEIGPYSAATHPDTVGSNDALLFFTWVIFAGSSGVARFEANGTYTTGTWLGGDNQDGASPSDHLFPGPDAVFSSGAPTDFVYWGDGAVAGTSKLLCLDDYAGAAGVNIAWVSM